MSKWGKRVEEVLAKQPEPPKEPSLQEQISAEAARLEIAQTQEFMEDAVKQRLGRTFPNHAVSATYNPQMCWYVVTFSVIVKGKAYTVTHNARDEDISRYATTVEKWKSYMDRFARGIRDDIKTELIHAGITEIETNRAGLSTNFAMNGSSFATGARAVGKSMQGMRASGGWIIDEAAELDQTSKAPSKAEEAAALASIQEALKHQGE